LSYLTGIALARISHYSFTRIDIILPCLMALGAVVYYHAGKQEYKKEGKYVLPISFVFALTLVVGSKVHVDEETFESFGALDVLALPVLTLLFSAVLVLLLNYTDQRREGHPSEVSRFRLTVLYSLCYLPYYLTFFPGNCGADTFESVNIALGNQPWTNHQPVLFTVLIKLIVDLIKGFLGLRGSLGVFSFIHMVVFAAVLSWLTCRIMKTTAPVWVKLFTAAFFALHPIIAMYSIYLTKDVIFGEILVILIMKLYDLAESRGELLKSPKFCLQTGALFLLSAMLRNNGLYILLGMTVVLLVVYAACRKQILLMALTVICLYAVWQGPVFRTLGIEKQSFAESASIPLQQIGYVIWTDGNVGEEEAAFLDQLMPLEKVKQVYNPGYTDSYKFDEEFDDAFLNDHVGEFMQVWWKLLEESFRLCGKLSDADGRLLALRRNQQRLHPGRYGKYSRRYPI
jgi:hypothetical protein